MTNLPGINDSARVALRADTLTEVIDREMAGANVPGLAVSLIEDGKVSYAKGFGTTSVTDPLPVTPDTVFRVGSVTKLFTATTVLRMVERGELDLDAPITEYCPRIAPRGLDPRRISLRLLLSHRAGLQNGPVVGRTEPGLIERSLPPILRRYAPVAAPDTVVSYSNLSIVLAGHVAESVARTPFAMLADELLFRPLGMTRTTFDPSLAMTFPLAQAHISGPDGGLSVWHQSSDYPWLHPGSFALSTVNDLARFAGAQCVEAAGGTGLLGDQSLSEMHRPHADWMMGDAIMSGLGCYVDHHRGWRRVGHPGIFFSGGAKLAVLPDLGVGAALVYNYGEGVREGRFRLGREVVFRSLFDALDVPAATIGAPSGVDEPVVVPDLGSYPGRYVGTEYDEARLVKLRPDGLTLEIAGASVELDRCGGNTYVRPARPGEEGPWHHVAYHTSYDLHVGLLPPKPDEPLWIMVNGKPYRRSD